MQFSIKKIGTITLGSFSIFHYGVLSQKVKDVRQREKTVKSLNIKTDSGEKLVFVFSLVFCKKEVQFIIADF